jgi:D-arginine dehydrogenase
VDGLFWYAGQGGYGIQTCPALARTAAALVDGRPVPEDIAARGLDAGMLAVDRPALRAS